MLEAMIRKKGEASPGLWPAAPWEPIFLVAAPSAVPHNCWTG